MDIRVKPEYDTLLDDSKKLTLFLSELMNLYRNHKRYSTAEKGKLHLFYLTSRHCERSFSEVWQSRKCTLSWIASLSPSAALAMTHLAMV
jgi:hypothetical protein